MSFEFIKKLPTPEEIRNQYPIDAELQALKEKRDAEIRDVFTGVSNKFLVIVGPCSADNEDAVCEYTSRLGELAREVSDKLLIIPRIYTNKPRTTGEGYKGMLHQPDPEGNEDMLKGIIAIRETYIRAMEETGFFCASSRLDKSGVLSEYCCTSSYASITDASSLICDFVNLHVIVELIFIIFISSR